MKRNNDGVSFERYKLAKDSTKAVQNVRAKMYKEVYEKLDTKELEKNIYRITRIRERLETCTVRCVKDENQKVLVRDEEIKKRWRVF